MGVLLAALRTLAGSACALTGFVSVLYGFIGGTALLLACLPGGPGVWEDDAKWLRASWQGLLIGFPLLWVSYIFLTSRDDVENTLRQWRRRQMLAVANQNIFDGGSIASEARQPSAFTWKGLLVRLATLWLVVWLFGSILHFWETNEQGLIRALIAATLCWLAALGFIFVHELGHFVAASLAGVRCTAVCVGTGPLLFAGHLRRVKLDVRTWPFSGGFAVMNFLREDGFRWRYAASYAGGPIAHGLAVAAVVWAALHASTAQAHMTAVLAVAGAYLLFVGSLMPFHSGRSAVGGTKIVFRDSAALLNTLRLPSTYIRWQVGGGLSINATRLAFSKRLDEQLAGGESFAALTERYPEHTLLRFQAGLAAMHRQQWIEAAQLLEEDSIREVAADPVPESLLGVICTVRLVALAMSGDFARTRALCLESLAKGEHPMP